MTDNKREQLIKTIEDLFAKANDAAATEAEAMQAGKMAQKLMAKYHIEQLELGKVKDDIVENFVVIRQRHWLYRLMNIVAHNFCCECFTSDKLDKESLKFVKVAKFYGRQTDVLVATKVFKSLLAVAQTGIRKASKRCYELHGTKKGVEKAYTLGFNNAVKTALEENCRALVLVIPQEVKDKYQKTYGNKLKTISLNTKIVGYTRTHQTLEDIYRQGENDGHNAAYRRKLHA